MNSKKSKQNPNFSFCPELPKCKEPRHCCSLFSTTTIFIILSILHVICTIPLIVVSMFEKNEDLKEFGAIGLILLSAFLVFTFISTYGIISQKPCFIIPHFVFIILLIFLIISLSIAVNIIYANISIQESWPLWMIVGIIVFVMSYYAYIVFSLYKFVKNKKETEQFIRNQNMFDDVCREMLEEDEMLERTQMGYFEDAQYSYEYYESFCSSESASLPITTFHRSFHPRVTFYDPEEPSL